MLIGILQTGHAPDPIRVEHGDYDAMFARLLAGRGLAFRTWDVVDGDFPPGPEAAEGWLITGSRHGAYEAHAWIPPLQELIRRIQAARRPLVGICFGHQIVAQALGGVVEKFEGGWSVGHQHYRIDDREMVIGAWHQDQVVEAPEAARLLATGPACANAMLAYGDRILTVEGNVDAAIDFYTAYLKKYPSQDPDHVIEAQPDHILHLAGLALTDTRMILSGAIPAALLALVVDALLALGDLEALEPGAVTAERTWTAPDQNLDFTPGTGSFEQSGLALVKYTGTPAGNRFAVFTAVDTVEGDADITVVDANGTTGEGKGLKVAASSPELYLDETGAAASNGLWAIRAFAESLQIQALDDAFLPYSRGTAIEIQRTGSTIDSIALGGNVTLSNSDASTGPGTGALQATGGIYAGAQSHFADDVEIGGGRSLDCRLFIKQQSDTFADGICLQNSSDLDSFVIVVGGGNDLFFGSATNASGANASGDFITAMQIPQVGINSNTTASAANMHVSSGNKLFRSTSSQRAKRNIRSLRAAGNGQRSGEDIVDLLRPVRFQSVIEADGDGYFLGLIAEEVAEVAPELVTYDAEGIADAVLYPHVVAPLIAAVQDLRDRVAALEGGDPSPQGKAAA